MLSRIKMLTALSLGAMGAVLAFGFNGPEDPALQSATITFSLPEGDDKDDNTTVDVTVSTKASSQFETTIASLRGFGDQTVWEDDGNHSYPYNLNVFSGIRKSMVLRGGIKTRIDWHPRGDDRAHFNYTLILRFADGSELTQSSPSVVEMSENLRSRTFE